MENSKLVDDLGNRRLQVGKSFDTDIDIANLLVYVLLVQPSPTPTSLPHLLPQPES